MATATTPLQPELKLTKTTGFMSQCVTPEVTDKEIDTVLERRRNYAAELVPHKGPAVKGNVVHMDLRACWTVCPSRAVPHRTRPCSWAAAG